MMLTSQIDVCGGMGLPAVMELISKGFKMIVTAGQIAQSAKPSAESKELRTVFQVGWTTYDDYIEENYDTILRFSSPSMILSSVVFPPPLGPITPRKSPASI